MNKGFTLVEIAVAIVIIGLIAGIALGVSRIINIAKIHSDVAKVKKFQSATMLYYTENGRLPDKGLVDTCSFDYKDTYSKYLKDTDYIMSTARSKTYFIIRRGSFFDDGFAERYCYNLTVRKMYDEIVISAAFENASDPVTYRVSTNSFPRILACKLENILDDKSLDSGYGRTYLDYSKEAKTIISKDYDSCNDFAESWKVGTDSSSANSTMPYTFALVFVD